MGNNSKGGVNPWLILGGLALLENIFDSGEKRIVQVNSMDYDNRDILKLNKEEEILTRKEELEKAKFPNSIENIKERVDKDSNDSIFALSSLVCACLCALGVMGVLSGEFECIPLAVFFGALTYILIELYKKAKEKKDIYMEYVSQIIIHGERSIIRIANNMNKLYDQVLKDITIIISNNYIKGFYVNNNSKMLEYSNIDGGVKKMQNNKRSNNMTEGVKNKCPSCGGSKLIETDGEMYCKYCGARL